MPSVSPHPSSAATPTSPHGSSGGGKRPGPLKRHSSQTTAQLRHGTLSPGSGPEAAHQPARQHVVKTAKHAKIVIPRNHTSARNLVKVARQAQQANAAALAAAAGDDNRQAQQHQPQQPTPQQTPLRSHDADTDIRLPGSLDESTRPHPMRRNLTSAQLPRNLSHTKLKKNLSHGQLTRLGSGRNLVGMVTSSKGPPSPGIRGKSKRPKSVDVGLLPPPAERREEKDLHQQEVELAEQLAERNKKPEAPKKVGFAVGSYGDASDEEDTPQMEGSGLQEDEWEDQSGSVSPETTRQNTANNSRRTSVDLGKPPDSRGTQGKAVSLVSRKEQSPRKAPAVESSNAIESSEESDESDDEDAEDSSTPPTMAVGKLRSQALANAKAQKQPSAPTAGKGAAAPGNSQANVATPSPRPQPSRESSTYSTREHSNPTTKHILGRSSSGVAPALVSNVSALNDLHTSKASPAQSMISVRSGAGDGANEDPEELVSRFIPSTSHPSGGSGINTQMNTPKQISFHTPENDSLLGGHHRSKSLTGSTRQAISPGSTVVGSLGATTPSTQVMSRTELRLKNEKFMADMEDAAAHNPPFPPHRFDRRNESLKSYLNHVAVQPDGRAGLPTNSGLSLGPEIFQGRFKAVNTELKVVQKFHDPIASSLARLQKCKSSAPANRSAQQKSSGSKLTNSKSALALSKQAIANAASTSPTKLSANQASSSGLKSSRSATQIKGSDRSTESGPGIVSVGQHTSDPRQNKNQPGDADAIARRLWEDIGP